ncbi:MAG: GtrA family protein [Bacteroidota bacterium]|nr:GtrA family protein [Bacteroidota bacterium]
MRQKIISFIDYFYPPFRKLMPLQTFRYAVCGGSNMLLDITLFYVSFNYILHQHILDLGFVSLKPYNAALGMAFCITFPLGFLLNKFIVFNSSYLRSYIQLFRYVLIVAVNLSLNYAIINALVQYLHFFPTIAKIIATVFIVTFSYLSQKHFTFRSLATEIAPQVRPERNVRDL